MRGGSTQSRGGKGLIDIQTDERNGEVVGVVKVENETDEYLLVTDAGVIIRAETKSVSLIGRNTKGVRLINLDDGTRVVSVARYAVTEDEVETLDGDGESEGTEETSEVNSGADGFADAEGASESE